MMNAALSLDDFTSKAGEAASLLKSLSNPHRLMILCQIGEGECQVADLAIGLSQSALSQHLARLREDALVVSRRQGTAIFYRIADPKVMTLIGALAAIYCPPVTSDQTLEG